MTEVKNYEKLGSLVNMTGDEFKAFDEFLQEKKESLKLKFNGWGDFRGFKMDCLVEWRDYKKNKGLIFPKVERIHDKELDNKLDNWIKLRQALNE